MENERTENTTIALKEMGSVETTGDRIEVVAKLKDFLEFKRDMLVQLVFRKNTLHDRQEKTFEEDYGKHTFIEKMKNQQDIETLKVEVHYLNRDIEQIEIKIQKQIEGLKENLNK